MNKSLHKIYVGLFLVVGISVTILLGINGYQYYTTPLEERFFSPDHLALKPSGAWGHGFGIIGTLMMIVGVAVYMIRKRYRKLFNIGYLKHWLEFHIFLCSVGPVLVLYHTAFKFGGIVSISFWSMVLVVLSGIVGRFIYIQIPRTIQGQELSINELNSMKESLALRIRKVLSEDSSTLYKLESIANTDRYKSLRLTSAISLFIRDYFNTKQLIRVFRKKMMFLGLSKSESMELIDAAKSEIDIARRIAFLRTSQKLFHWWHIFHLPFAVSMFVIMVIHVIVTIIFGYKWIF